MPRYRCFIWEISVWECLGISNQSHFSILGKYQEVFLELHQWFMMWRRISHLSCSNWDYGEVFTSSIICGGFQRLWIKSVSSMGILMWGTGREQVCRPGLEYITQFATGIDSLWRHLTKLRTNKIHCLMELSQENHLVSFLCCLSRRLFW